MTNIRKFDLRSVALGALALVVLSVPAVAADDDHKNESGGRLRAGVLTCEVQGGTGFIFGSTKELHCRYESSKGEVERYSGRINKYGIDIGVTGHTVMTWAVLAPTLKIKESALAGKYVGASAEATAGVGGGANLLVGGSSEGISLQPLSLQGQTGLNAALAIASLELRFEEPRK